MGPLALIAVIILIVAGLDRIQTNTYALTPGDATPMAPLVSLEGVTTDSSHDTIMMTDVWMERLSVWRWLTSHFSSPVEYIPGSWLTDPGVPASQIDAQGFLDMANSKTDAYVAALRALGWTISARPSGAQVYAVVSGSPAMKAHLHVGDIVTAVGNASVTSTCSAIATVSRLPVASHVTLTVSRVHITSTGVVTWPKVAHVAVTTADVPNSLAASGCPGVRGRGRSWLGLSLIDAVSYATPGTLHVNTSNIGGPSAGLAMTLTLIDRLSRGSLTGHHVIAATGTIDALGNVGDVGGVAEKTVAVARAGADYFFVPQVEYRTAVQHAPHGMHVIGVTTVTEVLSDLRAIGGQAPTPLTAPH
jgi:PDZ domain-containing protein